MEKLSHRFTTWYLGQEPVDNTSDKALRQFIQKALHVLLYTTCLIGFGCFLWMWLSAPKSQAQKEAECAEHIRRDPRVCGWSVDGHWCLRAYEGMNHTIHLGHVTQVAQFAGTGVKTKETVDGCPPDSASVVLERASWVRVVTKQDRDHYGRWFADKHSYCIQHMFDRTIPGRLLCSDGSKPVS